MNEKQTQFASKYVDDGYLLDYFFLAFIAHWYSFLSKHILLRIQFRSLHTYDISAPAFTISRTRQTFEASGKSVLPEDILTLLLANLMPMLFVQLV